MPGVTDKQRLYLNPVSRHPFADPFVIKHKGEYWSYSTGFWRDGRCFGILHSRDLIEWSEVGGAMEALPESHTCYWAPEVHYEDEKFLMYYSVGNETRMQIRVAVAGDPAGPFEDSGRGLTAEEFAIDPHVFVDDDGSKYLFYATDFLTHTHIGTGTVMDRMTDAFTLAGHPRPVTRARYDWQVYDPQRAEKGGVRWHTVEGPSVIKRKGRYYQMFSGGNWKNISYGVSYAFTDDIQTREEWRQASDGVRVLPILRTLPGLVIGPGHNSVVRGPDNQQWFCVYHRWAEDNSARLMCIDRLDWVGKELIVIGPGTSPQPAPTTATVTDFFDVDRREGLGENWDCLSGLWAVRDNNACQEAMEIEAEARLRLKLDYFVAELSARAMQSSKNGGYGFVIRNAGAILLRILLLPEQNCVCILTAEEDCIHEEVFPLPARFAKQAFHLFRVEVNGERVCFRIDEASLQWQGRLKADAESFSLNTRNAAACFAGFSLTAGWEDLFIRQSEDAAETGWKVESGEWTAGRGELVQKNWDAMDARIVKTLTLNTYELVVNARIIGGLSPASGYGVFLRGQAGGFLSLAMRRTEGGWVLAAERPDKMDVFSLPENFDPNEFHQLRLRKAGRSVSLGLPSYSLGEIECELETTQIELVSRQAEVAFEMVRVTALNLP